MILIIGGMGFIGLNTALRFLEVGQKVVLSQHSRRQVARRAQERGRHPRLHRPDGRDHPYEVFEVVRPPSSRLDRELDGAAGAQRLDPGRHHLYTAGLQNVLEAMRQRDHVELVWPRRMRVHLHALLNADTCVGEGTGARRPP